ncbi:N-acetylglucosamine-6-phosphate deacetylase [Albidovulum sp.]
MTGGRIVCRGGPIFDGTRLLHGRAAIFENGRLAAITDADAAGRAARAGRVHDLGGAILAPGYVDLQVNGGGGVMFNDDPSPAVLERIAAAHRGMGTLNLLPTLISDSPDKTRAAIEAVARATADGLPGIAGLHLEGPHLAPARRGAHDPRWLRPMAAADLDLLCGAARRLPALMVTLAPEAATPAQVRALAAAGVLVSLGHSDADFATCLAHAEAGARAVTHLFNAMSQLSARAPGLVGAALDCGALSAGLIADGIHVHPAALRAAWAAKRGPGRIFLVSDAMAVAGTAARAFDLGGRRIERRDGRLTLADGTLAGADLELTRAVRVMVDRAGLDLAAALAAATRVPAALIGREAALAPGTGCDALIRIDLQAGTARPFDPSREG